MKKRPDKRNNAHKYYSRGTSFLQRGKHAEAIAALEKARAAGLESSDLLLNLSGAYILAKRFKLAVPILESLTKSEDVNAMVWTNLGAAYLGNPILAKEADQIKAIGAFEEALKLNPIAPNVAYNIGLIYRDMQRLDDAKYWFGRAIQANPRDQDARAILARLEAGESR